MENTLDQYTMSTRRAHIFLPEDLLREIDALVGPRGRSAFLVETARSEVRRQKLLRFLEGPLAWNEGKHPELHRGSAAWVRKLRAESDVRGLAGRNQKRRSRRK
jgi:hypothetical protein